MNNKSTWRVALILLFSVFWLACPALARPIRIGAFTPGRYYAQNQNKADAARLYNIGARLEAAAGLKQPRYVFKVLTGGAINAMSYPGHIIFVFQGLIDAMPDDGELAGALAHEIAHAELKHTPARIATKEEKYIAYNHEQEYQADALGFNLLLKAGYNPYGLFVTISKLSLAESENTSHPSVAKRLERLNYLSEKAGILPRVTPNGQGAAISLGDWELALTEPSPKHTALQRAWLLAGNIYTLANRPAVRPEGFNALAGEDKVLIYYEKQLLFTLYAADVKSKFSSLKEAGRWQTRKIWECVRLLAGQS